MIRFRPRTVQPSVPPGHRTFTQFTQSWPKTRQLLAAEAERIDADLVIVELDISEGAIRNDGGLYSNAKVGDDGVVVYLESRYGPLSYECSTFRGRPGRGYLGGWQSNVRAVALALESLRRVDRYGVSNSGQQYVGWSALPAAEKPGPMTRPDAEQFLRRWWFGSNVETVSWERLYRRAAKELHPDRGGDPDEFRKLTEARNILIGS